MDFKELELELGEFYLLFLIVQKVVIVAVEEVALVIDEVGVCIEVIVH